MLAIPPFGASSNIALWRANIKPPVELVVADLERRYGMLRKIYLKENKFVNYQIMLLPGISRKVYKEARIWADE